MPWGLKMVDDDAWPAMPITPTAARHGLSQNRSSRQTDVCSHRVFLKQSEPGDEASGSVRIEPVPHRVKVRSACLEVDIEGI